MAKSRQRWWMARDQWGNTEHGLKGAPRKALLERLGRKHAAKMYVDKLDGTTVHVGWVVARGWWTVYEVVRMERRA